MRLPLETPQCPPQGSQTLLLLLLLLLLAPGAWHCREALNGEDLRVNNCPIKRNYKSFVMFHSHLL